MNLVPTAPWWLLAILALLLVAAAIEDVVRLRISNWTCLGVLAVTIVAFALRGLHVEMWQNALSFAILLGGGMMLFAGGKVGGGDVKLLALLGLWVNLMNLLWLLAAVFIAGGVLALGFISVRMFLQQSREQRRRGRIPYGLAIVVGAVIVCAGQLGAFTPHQTPRALQIRPL